MALPAKQRRERHFNAKPLRVENFIKVNDLAKIKSPIIFERTATGMQTNPDGLLSNEIFGITQTDRANTFAHIDLGNNHFLAPLFYKVLTKLDSKISSVVNGTQNFIIKGGELVPDENGETGLEFLYKNFEKLKFKETGSEARSMYIKFIHKFADRMWLTKCVVIPAFYRDVNSADDTRGGEGVGEINKMYTSLLIAANSLSESAEYGINMTHTVAARLQMILVQIYDWFTDGITGKFGLINRVVTSKSTDMSARVVISAPNLKVENVEDMMVDIDHSAVPMAALLANFFPYVMFWLRNFFQSELTDLSGYTMEDGTSVTIKDPLISFSDENIKEEIDRFIHGYSTRLRRVEVPIEPVKHGKETVKFIYLYWKGYQCTEEEYANSDDITKFPIQERFLTWCDLFYLALMDVTADKMVLITRYPIDSYYNQFPSKIHVYSTKKTEPMVVNGKFYKNYPYIRQNMYDTNTTNLFIDTLGISNVYLKSIIGDYDGDQVSIKSVYSVEATKELEDLLNSKRRFIGLGNTSVMITTNEGIDALYCLTMFPEKEKQKLGRPTF